MLVLRSLVISDSIQSQSIKEAMVQIMAINEIDDMSEEQIGSRYIRKPIKLFINSGGGSVYDGLALIDVMKQSKTPVYTISVGHSMSMGFWISLYGKKRYIGEHSTFMYHEVSYGIRDSIEGIRLSLDESDRLQRMIDSRILELTKIKQSKLDDYKRRKTEWYISSKEAISLGLAELYKK